MTDATQKKLNRCVRALGRLMQAEADQGLGVKRPKVPPKTRQKLTKWVSAVLDIRWFAAGGGYTAKFRVVLPNGSLHSIQISDDIADKLDNLSEDSKKETQPAWYGLKAHVTYDGAVTTEMNTDPNCVVDPTWFKSYTPRGGG